MLARNKYGLLLIALLCFILFSPMTTDSGIGRMAYVVLSVFTLVGVARGASPSMLHRYTVYMLGLIVMVLELIYGSESNQHLSTKITTLLFFIAIVWQFGLDVFVRRTADADTLCGSICIYLLIGTIFAIVFNLLQVIEPASFLYSSNNVPIHRVFDFYYFSFITLTTTGYGDIVPNTQIARSFSMIESVTGIFYLAILVAHLAMYLRVEEKE